MTPKEFCYWLAGALELTAADMFDKGQLDMIRETLTTVIGDQMDEAIEIDRVDPDADKAWSPALDNDEYWKRVAQEGGKAQLLDPNKSVEELIEAGLIQRGLAKNVAAHVPDARPEQLDLFPVDRKVPRWPESSPGMLDTTKLAPRWPDETTYDPEAEILAGGGKVVNMRDMCAKMATEINSNR